MKMIENTPVDNEQHNNKVKKAIELIQTEMENAFKLNVPLRVSIEYGKNWGEFH